MKTMAGFAAEVNIDGTGTFLPAQKSAKLPYTREQIRTIKADPARNALTVALAGSGKTTVVALQVAYLIKHHKFEPQNIVALSYSVRAADALRDRIFRTVEDKLSGPVLAMSDMGVDTLHAWAANVLRSRIPRYARFEVWNEATRRLFLADQFDRISVGRIPRRRSRKGKTADVKPNLTRDPHDIALFLEVIDRLREERVASDQSIGAELQFAYRAYTEALEAAAAWDYAQILVTLHDSLTDASDSECLQLQEWIRQTIRVVIVDEAQDLGAAEWAILERLHELGARLWIVADQRQCIYAWRSADAARIGRFPRDFNAPVYPLMTNFRSTRGVIDVANSLLREFLSPKTRRRIAI